MAAHGGGRRNWCLPLQMTDVRTQTFSLLPEILSVSVSICIGSVSIPVLPSVASAVRHNDLQVQGSVHVRCGRWVSACRHVHGRVSVRPQTHPCMSSNVRTRACPRMCLCVFPDKNVLIRISLLQCLCIQWFLITLPGERQVANIWNERESSRLLHLERQVGQRGSWNLTSAHCQRQATATKGYNRASAISWPSWTPVCSENCAYYNHIFAVTSPHTN